MLQESRAALGAGIGDIRPIREHLPFRLVCDPQFSQRRSILAYTRIQPVSSALNNVSGRKKIAVN